MAKPKEISDETRPNSPAEAPDKSTVMDRLRAAGLTHQVKGVETPKPVAVGLMHHAGLGPGDEISQAKFEAARKAFEAKKAGAGFDGLNK